MVNSVERTDALENENTNIELASDKANASSLSGNQVEHQLLAVTFPQFLKVDQFLFRPHQPYYPVFHNLFLHAGWQDLSTALEILRNSLGKLKQPHTCQAGIAHAQTISNLNILRFVSKATPLIPTFSEEYTIMTLIFWWMVSTKNRPQT